MRDSLPLKAFPDSIDWQAAIYWFEEAVAAGSLVAKHNLGVIYQDGFGVTVDQVRAFELFSDAAPLGLAQTLSRLAACYEGGLGVEADIVKAAGLRAQENQADVREKA